MLNHSYNQDQSATSNSPNLEKFPGEFDSPPPLTGGQKPPTERETPKISRQPTARSRPDWLSCTIRSDNPFQILYALALRLNCTPADFRDTGRGMFSYAHRLDGPAGAIFLWGGKDANTGLPRKDCHFSLPGKACALAGPDNLQKLILIVKARGGRCTRLDLATDDYTKFMRPADFGVYLKSASCVTYARRRRYIEEGAIGDPDEHGGTAYVGTKTSRQQLRYYDKNAESGGEYDCYRLELETRDDAAQSAMDTLAVVPVEGWGLEFARQIASFIDFREVQDPEHKERARRLDWWERLVGLVLRSRVYDPQAPKTIEEIKEAFEHQWLPYLAVFLDNMGGDLGELVDWLRKGRQRWKPKHLALLAAH